MNKSIEFINRHALNNSKTKQSHAFSRSPRFQQARKSPCQTTFYDINKNKKVSALRSTAFKFANQSRFDQSQKILKQRSLSPSPQQYSIPGFAQKSLKKRKGVPFNHSPKSIQKVEGWPGPGSYFNSKNNPENSLSATFPNSERKFETHWNMVGPGNYDAQIMSRSLVNIRIGNTQRFKDKIQESPAPGTYFKQRKFTEQSKIYSTPPKYSFSKSPKKTVFSTVQASPGPGQYNNSFSQFSQRSKRIFEILKRL